MERHCGPGWRRILRLFVPDPAGVRTIRGALPARNQMRLSGLPAQALELRDQMLLARKAHAKIGDKRPGAWNVERLGDCPRIEDRHPADAKAAGARGEPERMQRANGGIAARF